MSLSRTVAAGFSLLLLSACGATHHARNFAYAEVKACFEKTDGVVEPSGKKALLIAYANTLDDAAAALAIAIGRDQDEAQREVGNVFLPSGLTLDWRRDSGNLAAVLLSRVEPHGDPAQLPKIRAHAEAMYARCVGK